MGRNEYCAFLTKLNKIPLESQPLLTSTKLQSNLRPSEVNSRHLIEPCIKRSVEIAQPLKDNGIDERMIAPLGLPETVRRATSLALKQTRKALGRVEIEMLFGYDTLDAQEVLDALEFYGRINN